MWLAASWSQQQEIALQTHHVDSTLNRRGNDRFHVASTRNPRGVFVGWDHVSLFVESK